MESESLLLELREFAICPHTEPDQSTYWIPISFTPFLILSSRLSVCNFFFFFFFFTFFFFFSFFFFFQLFTGYCMRVSFRRICRVFCLSHIYGCEMYLRWAYLWNLIWIRIHACLTFSPNPRIKYWLIWGRCEFQKIKCAHLSHI